MPYMVALRRCIYYKQLFKAAEAWRILTQERMRSIIIPYVSRHCGLLNEISRVCGSSWYTPVTAVRSSAGPEIFIIVYFLPIFLLFPLCSITLRFLDTHHPTTVSPCDASCPFCSQPSFFPGTPCCTFRRSLMSHSSAASSPCPLGLQSYFPIPFLHYLPSHSVDAQNPGKSIRTATRHEKMKEWRSSKGNSAGGFSCLHQHLPPTPPIHRSVLPACHPFPSILLQTQQWIICFLSLRHC